MEWNDISPKLQRLFLYIFDYARINGDTDDITGCRPTIEIRIGGLKTGSTLNLCNGMTVNAETLFAVVTVRKLISVAIVRTLTTDDSALMFADDYDMCQQNKLL
jgi:hypothetical protein